MEPGVFAPEETLERGHGSCRDFAWLLVQLLRRLGLAARFVSGYSIQLKADVKPLDGPSGVGEDFTDLHAWAEVYLPGAGWIGLDATSGLLCRRGPHPAGLHRRSEQRRADQRLLRRSSDARGRPGRATSSRFAMSVTRIVEDPRVTKPYTEDTGRRSIAWATRSTARSQRSDVRLTMGGEPTFVSIDDPRRRRVEHRRARARRKRQLRRQAVPALRGALRAGRPAALRPGQVVPGRVAAALGAHHATSARTACRSGGGPSSSRDEPAPSDPRDGDRTPRRFARRWPHARCGVDADADPARLRGRLLLPVERAAAAGQRRSLLGARLDDAQERARLARVFEQGLDVGRRLRAAARAVGHAETGHPLGSGRVVAARASTCSSVPGDSPMGYRLPLEALPWVSAEMRQRIHERSVRARDPLPPAACSAAARWGRARAKRRRWRSA